MKLALLLRERGQGEVGMPEAFRAEVERLISQHAVRLNTLELAEELDQIVDDLHTKEEREAEAIPLPS